MLLMLACWPSSKIAQAFGVPEDTVPSIAPPTSAGRFITTDPAR